MEAIEYLKKADEICVAFNTAGACISDKCLVGLCKVCSYDLDCEDLKGCEVNYCPICGTKVEKALDGAGNTEQGHKTK